MKDLYETDGLTVAQIAERAGRSTKWVRTRLLDAGCQMRPSGRRISPDQRAAARAAYARCGSVDKAAATLGVDPKALRRRLGDTIELKHPGRPRCEDSDATIKAQLHATMTQIGGKSFPTRRQLRDHGERSLLAAIDRTGGARRWATEMGMPLATTGRRQ